MENNSTFQYGSPLGRGGHLSSSSFYSAPPPSPSFASPLKTPERQVSDRFIPDRGSQDHSLSRFYLTSKENVTPASLLRSPESTKSHSSPANIYSSEPYTQMLAKTLFPAPQTTVLGIHQPNFSMDSEEDRYTKSLGVVYEGNRSRHFASKHFRVIAQTPERILDAPELHDDFYLNLVDWSASNTLTVALGNTVYLWNASTGSITQLMGTETRSNIITGVSWHPDGEILAIGTNEAEVQIWNTTTKTQIQSIKSHSSRVGSLSWNGNLLATGSRDASICLTDIRDGRTFASLTGHQEEVCGLRWSPNGQQLASGGNDNQLNIWDFRRYAMECLPLFSLREHTAAIKALAWNPVQSNLLVSGGGTADKKLRFWDTATGECIQSIDAKSQVCGVLWSHSGTELVSSHGFSDNQLTLWKYPSLRKVTDLTGHSSRVLHLAMSPDGQTVVSAAGDETIRFWKCFPSGAPSLSSDMWDSEGVGSSLAAASPIASNAGSRSSLQLLRTPPKTPQRGYASLDEEQLR